MKIQIFNNITKIMQCINYKYKANAKNILSVDTKLMKINKTNMKYINSTTQMRYDKQEIYKYR